MKKQLVGNKYLISDEWLEWQVLESMISNISQIKLHWVSVLLDYIILVHNSVQEFS